MNKDSMPAIQAVLALINIAATGDNTSVSINPKLSQEEKLELQMVRRIHNSLTYFLMLVHYRQIQK